MEPVTIIVAVSAMMATIGVWQKERDYKLMKAEYKRVFKKSLTSESVIKEAEIIASLLPQRTLDIFGKAC